MKIKSFKVEGYRSLRDVTIKDLNLVNIFYGENNTGKSNILGSLEVFFSEKYTFKPLVGGLGEPEVKGEQKEIGFEGRVPIEESDFFIFEKNSNKFIKFNVDLDFDEKDIEENRRKFAKKEFLNLLKGKNISLKILAEIPHDLEIHTNISHGRFIIKSFKIGDKELKGKGSIYPELINNIGLYLIEKFSNISSQRQIVKEIDEGKKLKEIGDKNIQKFLHDLNLSDNIKDRIILRDVVTKFNEINQKIGEITFSIIPAEPSEKIEYDDRGVRTIKMKDRSEIKLKIISTREGLLLPIENFGSGVQQSLIIMANIIANKKALLFGIEELEANLSPRSQTTIFDKLIEMKNDNRFGIDQLFLTSHSPVFKLMEKKDCKVFKVTLEKGTTIVKEITQKEFIKQMKPAMPKYKLCSDCDDMIYSAIDKIAGNLSTNKNIVKKIYDEHSGEICSKCYDKNICDTTDDKVIKFIQEEIKKLIDKG